MKKPSGNYILEYLKTYGKAIIVIIIVFLALVFLLSKL